MKEREIGGFAQIIPRKGGQGMKKTKRLIAMLLSLVMILSCTGMQVLADTLPVAEAVQENEAAVENDVTTEEDSLQNDNGITQDEKSDDQGEAEDISNTQEPAALFSEDVNALSDEITVQVTVSLNAVTTTMKVTPAEGGADLEIGEPDGTTYSFQAAPGEYIITGYGTDGTTVNGTIGLTVTDSAAQTFSVQTMTAYAGNEGWVYGEDYTMELKSIKGRTNFSMGDSVEEGRKTFLLYRNDTYELWKIPTEKNAGTYTTTVITKYIYSGGTDSTAVEAIKWVNFILPSEDYKVEMGTLSSYYVYKPIEQAKDPVINEDGTATVSFTPPKGTYYYRISHEGDATYWDWITISNAGMDITVDPSWLTSVEVKKGGDVIDVDAKTVNRNLEHNQYETGDLLLNVNTQNYVKMDKDASFQMVPMRSWQAIENFINAKTTVPDFHFEVVDLEGKPLDGVVSVDDTGLITAEGEGTAVILITYDAMINKACYTTGIGAGSGGGFTFFSAIWPENTGVVVVSVGDTEDSGIDLGMTINEGLNTEPDGNGIVPKLSGDVFDGDLDYIYFTGEDGASYSFKPTDGVNVTVARPTLGANSASYSGFTDKGVSAEADGTVTLSGLTVGTNIVRLEKDGKQEFQTIKVKKMEYKLLREDGTEYTDENPPQPGDSVKVEFGQVFRPANKLAGIYNMGAKMKYTFNGEDVTIAGGQYTFAYQPDPKTITLKIPENYTETSIALTDGKFNVVGFGSPYGAHRSVTYDGVDQNFTATIRNGLLGSLPDIVIPVKSAKINATFEKDYYKAGEKVTAKVGFQRGEKVNALGYCLQYDSSVMTYLSAEAADGFTSLRNDADKNAGKLMRAVYVPEGKNITADENEVVFDTVTFMMTEDGKPSVEFATAEGDVDFSDQNACVMSGGKNLYTVTEVAYESSVTADMEAAAAVDELIAGIGAVTADSGDAIKAARDGYEALTDMQREYVQNLEVLENAEAIYDLWSKGDVNLDARINLSDLSQMLSVYGTEDTQCDITVDGVVNANDLSVLLTNYGTRIFI